MDMVRGYRGKISGDNITVDMGISGGAVYDFSCFGVDVEGRLSDDRYMIFYNQTESPNHEITYTPSDNGATFAVSLSELPQSVAKLVFTASIDGDGTMSQIAAHTLRITGDGEELAMTLSGDDFHDERAIISVEIYRKDCWRVNAVASGFNGGLPELLKNYGGEEMDVGPKEHDRRIVNKAITEGEVPASTIRALKKAEQEAAEREKEAQASAKAEAAEENQEAPTEPEPDGEDE